MCVCVCVCVWESYSTSSYEGADIFKAAGRLQAGAILLIFPPRTHHCSHCKSLSAEFLMNCTKAALPCMHSCMHTHIHTQKDKEQLCFVHSRNYFLERVNEALAHAERKCLPKIDFSSFLMITLSPSTSVWQSVRVYYLRILHFCIPDEDVQPTWVVPLVNDCTGYWQQR